MIFTFSNLRQKYQFRKKFCKHCLYKIRFGTSGNSNMQISMMALTKEKPFLSKFSPKNQIALFKMKFGTQANWDMLNLMVMFISSALDWTRMNFLLATRYLLLFTRYSLLVTF